MIPLVVVRFLKIYIGYSEVVFFLNICKSPSQASKGLDDIVIGYSEAKSGVRIAYSLRKRNDK